MNGLKFRRQASIGQFIVDFFCPSAKLIVEVDGVTHIDNASDLARDEWLRSRGYRVVRVWNNDVMANIDAVLALIAASAAGTPPPGPLPQGEGEQFFSPSP